MQLIDIVICVPVAAVLFFSIRAMVRNVKAGRSIDGCNGDCASSECACLGCPMSRATRGK